MTYLSPLIVACCVLLSLASQAQNSSNSLSEALVQLQQENNIPEMSIAVIRQGELHYQQGVGSRLFRIASLSKLITSQAIMQLHDRGKLKIDDKVALYLPELQGKPITIKQLLSHSAGISDTIKPDKSRTESEYLALLAARDVEKESSFEYSDTGFNILGLIISRVSGLSYENYIEKNIFQPAQMTSSFFCRPDAKPGNIAAPHYRGVSIPELMQRPCDNNFHPSEGMVSNTEDLSRWLLLTLAQDALLLSKASYEAMLTPAIQTTWGDIYMGLGWQLYRENGKQVARHPGGIRGYKSLLISYPETGDALILLTNASRTPRWEIARLIRQHYVTEGLW